MKNRAIRICAIVLAAYLILGALFYPLAGDSLHFTKSETNTVTKKATLEEMKQGFVIEQSFLCRYDQLDSLTVIVGTSALPNARISEGMASL